MPAITHCKIKTRSYPMTGMSNLSMSCQTFGLMRTWNGRIGRCAKAAASFCLPSVYPRPRPRDPGLRIPALKDRVGRRSPRRLANRYSIEQTPPKFDLCSKTLVFTAGKCGLTHPTQKLWNIESSLCGKLASKSTRFDSGKRP